MRAIAAPASLKGVLSAVAGAEALADGLRTGGAEAVAMPVADGGDGTLEVLACALGGEWHETDVSAPLGGTVRARSELGRGSQFEIVLSEAQPAKTYGLRRGGRRGGGGF